MSQQKHLIDYFKQTSDPRHPNDPRHPLWLILVENLLSLLNLHDVVFAVDALHCQKNSRSILNKTSS
jgi:hypothetical protein